MMAREKLEREIGKRTEGIIYNEVCLSSKKNPRARSLCLKDLNIQRTKRSEAQRRLPSIEAKLRTKELEIDRSLLPQEFGLEYLSSVFQVYFRRAVGGSLHTKVKGLAKDPACLGDLGDGQAFFNYQMAVWNRDQKKASQTMSEIINQLTCVSTLQALALEVAYVDSVEKIFQQLTGMNKKLLASKWIALHFNPLLTTWDSTRHLGPVRGGAWHSLRRHRRRHGAMAATGQAPYLNVGLYFYDRARGLVVGNTNLCEKTGQRGNCLSVGETILQITNHNRVGFGECSVLEGIQQEGGYLCLDQIIQNYCGSGTEGEEASGGTTPYGGSTDDVLQKAEANGANPCQKGEW